ncbi:MAG: flavodoxin domain-containing protein [Dehalococcoidia bacterium]|nr:flavodoxin domain-containing protein [Dehalococcoidia bacterium]
MKTELARGIYWVGAIDWNIRDFHGYSTHRGTTYNAYLIVDEKVALIDTVKAPFFDEMLARLRELIDPSKIDYVISNHVEMDHSGSLPQILQIAPDAKLVTTAKFGESGLMKNFHSRWPFVPVKEGSELSLGKRKLVFIPMPMLHWPDSMATYCPDEAIMFSNDAFGQHYATSRRFDDEVELPTVMQEAAKYYANILMPFSNLITKALEKLSQLKMDLIAPSHGIIWRSHRNVILNAYAGWAGGGGKKKVVIVYNTMWGSTEKMARALAQGVAEQDVEYAIYDLARSDRSDIITDVLTSRGIAVGSATLNNGMLPQTAAFLCYLKGLRPVAKIGTAFGSFGWGGGAVKAIEEELKLAGVEVAVPGISLRYVPEPAELEQCRNLGKDLAARVSA